VKLTLKFRYGTFSQNAETGYSASDLLGFQTAIGLFLELFVRVSRLFRVRHGIVDRLGFSIWINVRVRIGLSSLQTSIQGYGYG